MKEIYDIGIVFRGFILVNYNFKELPAQKELDSKKDLRGAFISAISSFAETAFTNNNLEYLESGNILFIFKMSDIKSSDTSMKEPIILYGLVEKKKKNPDKIVKKFLTKGQLVLESFIQKYEGCDFTEISQFESFQEDLQNYFIKKQESLI
ncbi:MAG: hypothetical protein EU532_09065 [Promethearchaeota archaeon]|nr:MAG: hypothetical protein EU532_09065 [Candidatus Lokiarchaeota archaeon]